VVDDSFLLCFNAHDAEQQFVAPGDDYALQWTADLDTAHPRGETDFVVSAGDKISLQPRSLLVLRKTA
jgi:isoamylase